MDEQKIRDIITSLGISDVGSFRQKIQYSKVPNNYRNTDIFVTTSRSNGTSVSILEAMTSGFACNAINVGDIPEWIEYWETRILISQGSPEQVGKNPSSGTKFSPVSAAG